MSHDVAARLAAWAAQVTGWTITSVESQDRWRPCWFLEAVTTDGDRRRLYFRGNRVGMGSAMPVAREADVAGVLGAAGIPVAGVHGRSDELDGVLFDALDGVDNAHVPPTEASAACGAYGEVLGRVHRLDVAPFVDVGLSRPAPGAAVVWDDHRFWVGHWRSTQPQPEPLIDFVESWLASTRPSDRTEVAPLVGDAGQFMWDGTDITGIIDLEMAQIGDPHHDLAFVRQRDFTEPLGDLPAVYAAWERSSGLELDRQLLRWFGVMAAIETPQALSFVTTMTLAPGDMVQYLTWYWQLQRCAVELLAEHQGIPLEASDAVDLGLDAVGDGDPMAAGDQQVDDRHQAGARALAAWRDRVALAGEQVAALNAADVALARASTDLDERVRAHHRTIVRTEALAAPVLGDAVGNTLSAID